MPEIKRDSCSASGFSHILFMTPNALPQKTQNPGVVDSATPDALPSLLAAWNLYRPRTVRPMKLCDKTKPQAQTFYLNNSS